MKIEFDPTKSEKNKQNRDLPFSRVIDFVWESAIFKEDTRKDYPEKRIVGMGYLDKRLHIICFTPIDQGVRVISFRKANKREVNYYEKITNK